MPGQLSLLFNPRSIAVVGASPRLDQIGGRPVRFLLEKGYGGRIFPVHPRCEEIAGLPCYATVEELPETPDVALVLVRAARVPDVLAACARRGVSFAVVFAAGFAETGGEGAALDARVREVVASTGMRVVGPNCYGSLNVVKDIPLGLATPFELKEIPRGPVGMFSQSGAFGFGFLTMAMEAGVGFSYVLNTGNSVDVGLCDMMEFLADDPDTRVVAAYVEGIADEARFSAAARACLDRDKPVVILRVGRTPAAARAARAHTASDTGDPEAFRALADELGIVLVRDPEELLDVLVGLAYAFGEASGASRLPEGPGVAVLTTSGASGILFAEAAEERGLRLPTLGGEALAHLRAVLPPFATAGNPIDTTAAVLDRPNLIPEVLDILSESPVFGSAAVMVSAPTGAWARVLAEGIRDAATRFGRPLFVSVLSGRAYTAAFRREMADAGIPVFQSPHRLVRALAALVKHASRRSHAGSPVSEDR